MAPADAIVVCNGAALLDRVQAGGEARAVALDPSCVCGPAPCVYPNGTPKPPCCCIPAGQPGSCAADPACSNFVQPGTSPCCSIPGVRFFQIPGVTRWFAQYTYRQRYTAWEPGCNCAAYLAASADAFFLSSGNAYNSFNPCSPVFGVSGGAPGTGSRPGPTCSNTIQDVPIVQPFSDSNQSACENSTVSGGGTTTVQTCAPVLLSGLRIGAYRTYLRTRDSGTCRQSPPSFRRLDIDEWSLQWMIVGLGMCPGSAPLLDVPRPRGLITVPDMAAAEREAGGSHGDCSGCAEGFVAL